LRDNTERPITISEGTARLVKAPALLAELKDALAQPKQDRKRPEFWDGQTAGRCVEDLRRRTAV
jgi:UDP-N-acetylglucosamine 2-epimerase (non-hydrolysing)